MSLISRSWNPISALESSVEETGVERASVSVTAQPASASASPVSRQQGSPALQVKPWNSTLEAAFCPAGDGWKQSQQFRCAELNLKRQSASLSSDPQMPLPCPKIQVA
jgi:hypothetical protein